MKFSLIVTLVLCFVLPSSEGQYFQQKSENGMQLSKRPEYVCTKIDRPLKLTGKLDDPLWQQAPPAQLYDAVTGQPGRFATRVRVLYDEMYLYVGFECEDEYVWGTVTERDGPIWNEECVEVFLNPARVQHQYYEINVSPNNVIFDTCILNRRTPERPNATFIGLTQYQVDGLQTAVHVAGERNTPGGATGWAVEYAIPHKALIGAPNVPPQPGDVWRVNFYRIDSPEAGRREHYAWSMTGREAFHLPWRFGDLRFE